MKKFLIFILLVLLCTLAGCNTNANNFLASETFEHKPFNLIENEDGYIYQIYDGDRLVEEGALQREPNVDYITDSLMCITVQTGTGRSTNWGFFYDYASGMRSDTYIWVLGYSETKVILGAKDRIIVRNIFDDSYFEIADFEHPLAAVPDSIMDATFSDDRKTITVTYVVAESYNIVTQDFSTLSP